MPVRPTYPGVYVSEIPSGVHAITGVSTSDTAFVDFFKQGPTDRAIQVTSWTEFERTFGGLDQRSDASYAIYQYFLNGGQIAWVVRVVPKNAAAASRTLVQALPAAYYGYGVYGYPGSSGGVPTQPKEVLTVKASSPGEWGKRLQVGIDYVTRDPTKNFNLVVRLTDEIRGELIVIQTEVYRNLSMTESDNRYVLKVINDLSPHGLITVERPLGGVGQLPGDSTIPNPKKQPDRADVIGKPDLARWFWLGSPDCSDGRETPKPQVYSQATAPQAGSDGDAPSVDPDIATNWETGVGSDALDAGLELLRAIEPATFNLLVLPGTARFVKKQTPTEWLDTALDAAVRLCEEYRAFLLVDVPKSTKTRDHMLAWKRLGKPSTDHAAVYFPRLEMADPLDDYRPRNIGPSGTMAGIYARIDSARGVWKAPAGIDASLRGTKLVTVLMNDVENGLLNPVGANVLREFPIYGQVCWGARTLKGSDVEASEWKYVPVRRTALFIETSLYKGLKWVVFEPNDEPLWAQIRLNVGAFMQGLFRRRAFQGSTPREAYFVKCDKETTTQNDIDLGVVNILVGFAPLKPAEFVMVQIQQMTGQIQV